MKVSEITANFGLNNKISHKGNIGKAALISAMLMTPNTASQMPTLENDTFERSPKTEYVTEPNDDIYADSVYVVNSAPVGNKERGEKFNKWFWDMLFCANDDGSFNANNLNGASFVFEIPNKDYKQLATDIVSTFDKNGDNKVNYDEYTKKSEELVNQKAGRKLNGDEMHGFYTDFFIPWFKGFNYDRNPDEYSVDEVAASLYALDQYSSFGKGALRGDKLLLELGYVMDNGSPDRSFQASRTEYYTNHNLLK